VALGQHLLIFQGSALSLVAHTLGPQATGLLPEASLGVHTQCSWVREASWTRGGTAPALAVDPGRLACSRTDSGPGGLLG
jgi:hypothetical protein